MAYEKEVKRSGDLPFTFQEFVVSGASLQAPFISLFLNGEAFSISAEIIIIMFFKKSGGG
jgi:hypothetical protein